MRTLAELPEHLTFVHEGARDGFEAVFVDAGATPESAVVLTGGTTAVEDGVPWSVHYRIAVDRAWRTTRVEATSLAGSGRHRLSAEVREGRWWVDGVERPDLDGCVDIDFEASLVTNTLPVHRLDLDQGVTIDAPAAFVSAPDLRVGRIEQTYRCAERREDRIVVDYTSATFDVACALVLDRAGLVLDYPGLGRRHA